MLAQRATVLVAAISTVFLLADWGGDDRARAAQDEKEGERDGPSKVTLEIEGEKGAPFSGFCTVGEERHELTGDVPQSYEYELGDRKLACEIRKQDAQSGGLEAVLSGENTRSELRIEDGEGAIRLAYDGDEVSTSMFSSRTVDAGSSASSATNDGDLDKEAEELADEIKEKVNGILERAIP